jgi:hypothetical protein
MPRPDPSAGDAKDSLLANDHLEPKAGAVPEKKPDLRPLTADQKWKWFLIVLLQLLGTVGWQIPGPLMIFLQSAYFNGGEPCITRAQTDTAGCKEALATLSFVSGWFQAGSGILAFVLSPVIGKLSDTVRACPGRFRRPQRSPQ